MTKQDILNLDDKINGEIDFARPIEWDKKALELGIEPAHYVWFYPSGSNSGQPLNLFVPLLQGINSGKLIPEIGVQVFN